MKFIKCFILFFLIFLWGFVTLDGYTAGISNAPVFEDYAKKLTKWEDEHLYDIDVSSNASIKENVQKLFFPTTTGWGALWSVIRYAGMVLVFIYILYSAIQLITSMWKPEKLKSAITNLLYVLIWSFLFFWSMWIFWTMFNIGNFKGTSSVADNLTSNWWLPFFILSLLKWAAFFIAIVYIVSIWFQLMNPSTWESWNGKKIIKSLANIIFALVAIKVVDFLYYIASQKSFATEAWNFIIQIAKFLAYLSGIVIVFMIIYSGYLLVVDWWKWENFKKAKNTLINIVLAIVALFFFLFILYQIFAEFWGNS